MSEPSARDPIVPPVMTPRESPGSGVPVPVLGGGMVIFENDQTGKPKLRTLWKLSTGHYDTCGTLGNVPRHEFYLFSIHIFLLVASGWWTHGDGTGRRGQVGG